MLFPYTPRASQQNIVGLVRSAVSDGKAAVFESGTGTGKTICSLVGALEGIAGTGRKIIYLTRTRSQHRQVIHECRSISKEQNVTCIGIQGRNASTCPLMKDDPELLSGTPEELSRLCSDLKKRTDTGCKYYHTLSKEELDVHERFLREEHPDPEELIAYARSSGLCAYELAKALLPSAEVIVAPYAFMFIPRIRQHFLDWVNVPLNDLVLIVDEAHNIPDYLRSVMTSRYSENALRSVISEASEWNDPKIHDGISVTDMANEFAELMSEAISEYLAEEDGLIPPYFLEEGLMSSFGVSSVSLNRMYKAMEDIGEIIAERKRAERKLPRSYIRSFGRFLQHWTVCDDEMYIKLITAPPNAALESYCMDPYPAAEPLRICHSSVHMSGTLQPLEQYCQLLDIDAVTECFPSPFDPADLLTLYVDGVSTKYDDMMSDPDVIRRIEEHTLNIIKAKRMNSAVFFPSYSLMERFIADGIPERFEKDVFYERQGTEQTELMEEITKFRCSGDAVLFAVSGGRVSEGLDFPDKDLEIAVIVGIPYPRPSARLSALTRYCDIRYGDGWGQAVKGPTVRKMRQAIGRLIRSETDRGVAVILDKRAASIRELNARPTDDPVRDISDFFAGTR